MAGLSTGAGAPVVMVYHEKSMILPDVSRVLACLYEKDVKFECVKDSYKDILRLQASRSVPVPFYDGPTFLQESRAICRYIAETYKQRGYPFLLGKDVLERASIEQWLRHEEHAFDPPSRALFCHLAFPLHDEDDDNINREKRKLEEVLAVYEQRLGESEFLAGNKFTLADLAHLPNTHHIVTSEKFAYLYDSRKNVQRWWNTISARDSWQQVLRDMKSVKEQYQMEEYEQQQQQWQKEPPPTYGGSNIRIDSRAHTGTVSQIIVVPPPSTDFIATSFPSVQQEEQPPPAKTTSHDKSSPIQQKESNFFTTNEKTPTTTKTPPRTETDKSSSKDASPPTKPSQTSSKEAPDKIHDSDKVAPDKPSPTSAKAPHKIDEHDFYEIESKPASVMAHDDHGATEPQKQEPAPPVPIQSPTTSAGRDDDLAQLSTIDQWRHKPAPPSPIQQVSPGAPSIDEVAKTASVGRRAPTSTPKQTPTDARNALAPVQGAAPSADGISDEQSDKSIMDERVPELTPRQAPSSDTRRTSASIQEALRVPHGPSDDMLGKTSGTDQIATPAASKQTPAREEVPNVRDTSDDTTKQPAVDTKAAPTPPTQEPVSSSQQTTEQIKGVAPTSNGITGDESAKIAMADESATPPAPASDGRVASTALKGGILDARIKNEAVASVADPRGMPTTPRRPASTPDTQRRTTPDQASDQAPPFPSFAETMNEKTGIAEAGRTNTIAPNEQPGGRIPKNAGAPSAGPSPMKSQKNMDEAYNDGPSIQQLSSDQSRAQLAENKKQGDDATPLTEIGKPKEDDFLANANQNNTGQAQVTSTDGPSKLQMQSDQNKPISSKDIGKRTNETVSYKSSATSREMLPSVPEKSMRENQLQGDKSSISLQDNVKQGSEAALSVSGTKQPKKRDLLANVDQNSGKTPGEAIRKSEERTSSDTQQVKSNTGNSKSDGSSKPTQFDGNEGNLPESQRRGSSTSP